MTVNQTPAFSVENPAHKSRFKELLVVTGLKKESIIWKLLFLVFVGVCGLLMGFAHASQRNLLSKAGYYMQGTLGSKECSGITQNSTTDYRVHHPKPKSFERQECICTPVHYFVIISMQRSGSGWFEAHLNNHPNISSHGEIFGGRGRHESLAIILRRLEEVYSLDYRSSAMKEECTSAVGLKWMLNQGLMVYHEEMSSYFTEKGISVIFLLRRNLLRRLVSILANAYDREMKLLNGTHKSHVHSKEEAERLAIYKPFINHEVLITSFRRVQEVTENALKFFNSTRHIVVYYEDLVESKEKMNEVQKFLGVPLMSLESQQVKIHTRPLPKQIQNWNQVYKTLKGTQFEDFLTPTDYT